MLSLFCADCPSYSSLPYIQHKDWEKYGSFKIKKFVKGLQGGQNY